MSSRFRSKELSSSSVIIAVSASTAALVVWIWRQKKRQQSVRFQARVECACGKVCLQVDEAAHQVVHMVCYCDHCQHYAQCLQAHHKGQRSVVDAQGGTRTCQVFRKDVQLIQGEEYLQFSYFNPNQVPLRPQQMFRAHTTCCKTPLISAFWRELPVMGLYAANLQLVVADPDNNENKACRLLQVSPTTSLWEDDPNHPLHRINCQCALVQPASAGESSDEPTQQQDLALQKPPQGSPGFPLGLLLRFLWRSYVVGPKIHNSKNNHQASVFGMPIDHKPILIPSEMTSAPVAFSSFWDLIFG
jgi:Family of unknown function (DUF6151)